MDNLVGRNVIKVQLHEAAHVLGLGSVPTTFDSSLGGALGGASITLTELGVYVQGKSSSGKWAFVLPLAACKNIQLEVK